MTKTNFFKSDNYAALGANEEIFELVKNNSKVLDVGCACGRLAEKLKKEKNCFVAGLEADKEMAAQAASRCDEVVQADVSKITSLPFAKNYFDYIIFADILEHLVNPDEVLLNLKDYLSDRGFILLSMPNIANWQVRLGLFFLGRFNYGDPLIDGGHLRFFTLSSAKKLLEVCGFRIVYLTNRNARIGWLGKIWKSLFAFQFIIKAEKVS